MTSYKYPSVVEDSTAVLELVTQVTGDVIIYAHRGFQHEAVKLGPSESRRLAKQILEHVGEGPKLDTTAEAIEVLRERLKSPPYNACSLADELLERAKGYMHTDRAPNNRMGLFVERVPKCMNLSDIRVGDAMDMASFFFKHGIPMEGSNFEKKLHSGVKNLINKVMPELAEDD